MESKLSQQEYGAYIELLIKALRGVRSTLRLNYPEYVHHITALIEMERGTFDDSQVLLLKAHQVILDARDAVYRKDPEASNLIDVVHNMPYGLLGRFDGKSTWDWRAPLQDAFRYHKQHYLSGLRKYTGVLEAIQAAGAEKGT